RYADDLESGGRLLREELVNQRKLWRIYQLTGVRLEGLNEGLIRHAQVLDSILPMSERTWRPMSREFRALASGLDAFNKQSARNLMILTRNAAAAEAFGEPIAVIDKSASRLLRTLSPLNYQLAKMGISQAITSSFSKELAEGQARITKQTLRQASAIAEAAASFDRLALPTQRNLILGSQLYDIYKGNSRMALQLENSIREATGVLDYHSRGLHLVNRALRAQNANFEISYDTLRKITEEGWGAFTAEQRAALVAIREAYQQERQFTGSLSAHQRALLQLIEATDEYDKALHFELRTAQDAQFLLKRLQTVGYEGLTAAEKKAIQTARKRLPLTWEMDERMKSTLKRVLDLADAYTQQNTIFGSLTRRQQLFLSAITRIRGGMSRISRLIDRISIGSLKLLGPIFLAQAAFNTFSRIVGECVSSFTKYEDRLIDLRVAGELSLSSVNRLSEAFISLEKILPISATQLAEIATLAAKAGITGTEQIKAFTLAIAKFTKVTGWSADQASDALLKISRAFSLPIENSEKLASMMHHLAVVSVADAKDIVNAMTRVGAAATNLGITADMAAAMATTLIDAGMGAERAGTRLRAFFREFLEKSDKIAKVMEGGAGFQNFAKIIEDEPAKALRLFLEYLHNIPDEVERSRIVYSIFGSVASFAILTLVEHYDELTKRMQEAERELTYGTRLTEDFSVWMDAASTSIAKAENSINRLQRAIGAGLAPVVTSVTGTLADMLENLFGIDTHIKLTTRGTQEWVDVFEKGYPVIDEFNRGLTLSWQIGRLAFGPFKDGATAATEAISQIDNEWREYTENVATGGDIVFGYAGRVLDILDRVGGRASDINSLESEHQQIQEDLNKAFKIRNYLENKYGKETLKNIAQKIENNEKLTEQEEELRDEALEYARVEWFIAWASARREFIERRLMDTIAREAALAVERRELADKDIAVLNDYLTLYNAFDKSQKSVNYDTAIGIALLTKYGPLYADLKKNIDPKKLEAWANELETAAREGKPLAPIIGKIVYEITEADYALYLGADGWRMWNREAGDAIPTAEEIAKAFDEIKKSAEDLNKASPEEFLDSLDKGWRSIEKFMNATASATRAKIELDKALRFTPAGIMFEAKYGEQIDRIIKLMEEYQNATNAAAAAEKEQQLMAELLALQQAVLNDIQSESSLVLQEQKLAWLDIIDTMYEWIEGITSEVPLAAKSLEDWKEKYAEIAAASKTTFKQLEDAIESVTDKIGALNPVTKSVSETAEKAAPGMQTYGEALGTIADNATTINDELEDMPNNIQNAKNTADKNPINITASSNISDVLSEINKSIEEYAAPAIKIPIEFILPPTLDIMWHALVSIIGGAVKSLEGLISLSFELAKPKRTEEKIGVGQYGGEIQRTGLYLLHGREYVLPKRDLQRLIDTLYLMTRREQSMEYSTQRIYNIRIEGEPTPGAARFIRELEYIS
ncbi:phage tail tape measure protein, partial [Nanoarchaeota archaeon]